MIELIVISTLILWLAFISVTKVVDEKDEHWTDLRTFEKIYVGAFVIIDVLHNFLIAPFIFLEPASMQRKTLTARLKDILSRQDNEFMDQYWRKPIALFMCKYMIEPWDAGHCGLKDK